MKSLETRPLHDVEISEFFHVGRHNRGPKITGAVLNAWLCFARWRIESTLATGREHQRFPPHSRFTVVCAKNPAPGGGGFGTKLDGWEVGECQEGRRSRNAHVAR